MTLTKDEKKIVEQLAIGMKAPDGSPVDLDTATEMYKATKLRNAGREGKIQF
jgi:hypothetical protein